MGFLAGIGVWLGEKFGVFLGSVLFYVFKKGVLAIWDYGRTQLIQFEMRRERRLKQKAAEAKQEGNIEKGAPRNEQTRKDELDNLNS